MKTIKNTNDCKKISKQEKMLIFQEKGTEDEQE